MNSYVCAEEGPRQGDGDSIRGRGCRSLSVVLEYKQHVKKSRAGCWSPSRPRRSYRTTQTLCRVWKTGWNGAFYLLLFRLEESEHDQGGEYASR